MRKIVLSVLALIISIAVCGLRPTTSAHLLANRLLGTEKAKQIAFKQIKSDIDKYVIASKNGKIVISGNNANSMATGLGYYLKYCCKTNVSWDVNDSIFLPNRLPLPESTINNEATVKNRFYLNYCTFGYTMCWWDWRAWERFIDWMTINGINLPLAITGQEAIWYNVWKQLGLSDMEIRSYFTGPAHLPWHRMINIDNFQGPLPMSWLRNQEILQKKIVNRERELGMRPVLPAFAGHVPAALKKIYPNAKITQTSSWGGFRDCYRSHFLDPKDSLFNVIQEAYLNEQTKLYGTDHYYGVDPFNEIAPPSWEPQFLSDAAKTIYNSIAQNDKDAIWVQMTWLFYIDQGHWTKPRIEAFLSSVPKNRLILLDYFAENTEVWQLTDSYFNHDFIWCYLGNFGGNTMLAGNLHEAGRRINNTFAHNKSLNGIGSTLEGIDSNPIMYEYVLEHAWSNIKPDNQWVSSWSDRRIGFESKLNREAWQILADSVYTRSAALGQAPLVNSRPVFTGYGNWTTNPYINYDNHLLRKALEKMITATKESTYITDAHRFDVVNILRQYMSNKFLSLRDNFTSAYKQKDFANAKDFADKMTELLTDLDQVVSLHPYFSLGIWLNDAESFAASKEEKLYYRRSACTLLTTWGETPQSLNDYASRTWSGLTQGYYYPRWKMFLDSALNALKESKQFDEAAFKTNVTDFERKVSEGDIYTKPYERVDDNTFLSIISKMLEKYSN